MEPIKQFEKWFNQALKEPSITEPTAMSLATVGEGGKPSVRIVLLKHVDEHGFVFYTNMLSRKSREILMNPYVALCFHWPKLEKQVRVEGKVERVSEAEADEYFASRHRLSQIGAWASEQSQPLDSRETLLKRAHEVDEQYKNVDVPRPPHWSGWRVLPNVIEFWSQGEYRLHTREVYTKSGKGWMMELLNP